MNEEQHIKSIVRECIEEIKEEEEKESRSIRGITRAVLFIVACFSVGVLLATIF